ncbi:MAG: hypothetical protein JWQ09_5047, partial [Segetibacter sp.]|nr:hypothetical protein [Segetibacter sp.]
KTGEPSGIEFNEKHKVLTGYTFKLKQNQEAPN